MRARSPTAYPDLTGRTFGRLTVVRLAPTPPGGKGQHWLCRCECGGTCTVTASAFNSLDRRSCGRCGRRRKEERTHHAE